jgi:hypothetical protein
MSLNLDIDSLPPEQVEAAITRLEALKAQRAAENKLAHYVPYPKQRDFHTAGRKYRERLLMAGNQVGKTLAAAMETAMHVTGLYPDWWQGHRFDRRRGPAAKATRSCAAVCRNYFSAIPLGRAAFPAVHWLIS